MSASTRSFPDLGRKLLPTQPLKLQTVAIDDSVLGPYRDPAGNGLNTDYETLIQPGVLARVLADARSDLLRRLARHRPPDRGELLDVLGPRDPDVRVDAHLGRQPLRSVRRWRFHGAHARRSGSGWRCSTARATASPATRARSSPAPRRGWCSAAASTRSQETARSKR